MGKPPIVLVALLLLFLLTCNGCILVPFINSAKQSGLLRSDRERLLQEEVTKFHRVRFWGKSMQALGFASDEGRESVGDFLRAHSEGEKVVESAIDFVDFQEDAYRAEVAARIKYYRVPYYVVEERIENQNWAFSVASGWKITDVRVDKKL
ncbi:MAG: hypothetical protein KDD70_00780 [Bdellovibrionales bacterium]|nr:hypothetical protein [Bdellovibrionales bacterium]